MNTKVLIALLGSIQAVSLESPSDNLKNYFQGPAEDDLAQDWDDEDNLAEEDSDDDMQLAQFEDLAEAKENEKLLPLAPLAVMGGTWAANWAANHVGGKIMEKGTGAIWKGTKKVGKKFGRLFRKKKRGKKCKKGRKC